MTTLVIILVVVIIVYIILLLSTNENYFSGGRERLKDLKKSPRTKTEARLIAVLEELVGKKFPTVIVDGYELDGYSRSEKLAIEFQGPLHTKWNSSVEPYEKYLDRIARDEKKIELCKKKGIDLIVVDMSLPTRHYRAYLKSRLFDIGKIKEKPWDYIDEQIVKPWLR